MSAFLRGLLVFEVKEAEIDSFQIELTCAESYKVAQKWVKYFAQWRRISNDRDQILVWETSFLNVGSALLRTSIYQQEVTREKNAFYWKEKQNM